MYLSSPADCALGRGVQPMQPEKKVSIKDVASLAGVSVSTVSRVLNNGTYVAPDKREQIMKAIEELNYRPNYFAKGLKAGSSELIALIVPNINNPVYALIAQGVETVARAAGYTVVLCNTGDDLEVEMTQIEQLKSRNVDGFIFASATTGSHHIRNLIAEGMPVVEVMRSSNDANAVTVDNFRIGYSATEHLLERGHRKIFILTGDQKIGSYRIRTNGYRQAMIDYGVPVCESNLLFANNENIEAQSLCLEQAIAENGLPDAVFCVNWLRAIAAYRTAKHLGLKIPEDFSVISVDDLEFTEYLNPALTTISQPFCEMGKRSAEMLIGMLGNKDKQTEDETLTQIIMPTKLIVRSSVLDKNRA